MPLLKSLQQAAGTKAKGLNDVVAGRHARDRIVAERLNKVAPEVTANLAKVKTSVHEFQGELERRTRVEQTRNEVIVTGVTLAGILVGIGFAWAIIRGVTRGITGVAGHAEARPTRPHPGITASLAPGAARAGAGAEPRLERACRPDPGR